MNRIVDGIASSTLDAGVWLLRYAPDRFRDWIPAHRDPAWCKRQIVAFIEENKRKAAQR